jgi:hypothetical protein
VPILTNWEISQLCRGNFRLGFEFALCQLDFELAAVVCVCCFLKWGAE